MGLEGVLREVEARGEREAMEILDKAQKEVDSVMPEARAQARKLIEEAEKGAQQEVERMRRAQIPASELEARRALLQVERETLAAVLARARERLTQLESEKNSRWLSLLAQRALKDGGKRLFSSSRDAPLLKSLGHPVAGNLPCAGGVAAESSDGTAWMDYTYDTLLEEVWRASLREVHQVLFSGTPVAPGSGRRGTRP